jgi:hypothetical protein
MSEVNLAGDGTAFLGVCVSKLVEQFLRECASACEKVVEVERKGEGETKRRYSREGAGGREDALGVGVGS